MPKLYLLGGENVFKRSAREVNEEAIQQANQPRTIVVFPWARPSFDKEFIRRRRLTNYLATLGAYAVDFIEYGESKIEVAKKISRSNIIYLTGGQVSILLERLQKMEIDSLIKNYNGTIIGRSAGALVLCKTCLTKCRSTKKVKLVNCLDLFPYTVKAHYTSQNDSALEKLSKVRKIFAIPANSAIIYNEGAISTLGEAYLFENGRRSLF